MNIRSHLRSSKQTVRRSTRERKQWKQSYIPSHTLGQKYETMLAQCVKVWKNERILHPDSHLVVNEAARDQPDVVQAILTQLSMKAGRKEWGKKADKAIYNEMAQLHHRNTFKPLHRHKMTAEQKKQILRSHAFLKKKRTGEIKARTVAGGNKQRDFISKEDASSPTVATESVLYTGIIDAKERRDVATLDVPNAFITTKVENQKDRAIIQISGYLVEVLLMMDKKFYESYVWYDKKGVPHLIVECLNAIYGTMMASLLFYKKLTKVLLALGFEINPYDPCVANRMVNGKQQTIVWHVDDCKISHADATVNDRLIETLRKEFEVIFEDGSGKMKVTRGEVHDFLGMTMDYRNPGVVKVSMFKYLKETLEAWDGMTSKRAKKECAAPPHLFVVKEDCEKLDRDKKEKFHSIVAKLLFAAKRARPDIGTAVSFLTTRVQEPDKDDWAKLGHLMSYLRHTIDLPLILGADGSGVLKWYIDSAYGIHPKLRGQTGGGVTLGRGMPVTGSTKQKLNTRSSTECELVGVDDFMPSVFWAKKFLECQGYTVRQNLILQDNKSAILLQNNGKASSGKRTKHIDIRYFFVTDRIQKGDVEVAWCPTDEMTGDFFTKPVQGRLFKRFRDLIMGVVKHPTPRKEARGNGKKEAGVGLASAQKSRRHRSVLGDSHPLGRTSGAGLKISCTN